MLEVIFAADVKKCSCLSWEPSGVARQDPPPRAHRELDAERVYQGFRHFARARPPHFRNGILCRQSGAREPIYAATPKLPLATSSRDSYRKNLAECSCSTPENSREIHLPPVEEKRVGCSHVLRFPPVSFRESSARGEGLRGHERNACLITAFANEHLLPRLSGEGTVGD
jgi:hypothetical protein